MEPVRGRGQRSTRTTISVESWQNLQNNSKIQKFNCNQETTGIVCSSAPVMIKWKTCKSFKVATILRTSCLICEQSPTLDENNELFCCLDLLLSFFDMIHFCECVFEIRVLFNSILTMGVLFIQLQLTGNRLCPPPGTPDWRNTPHNCFSM